MRFWDKITNPFSYDDEYDDLDDAEDLFPDEKSGRRAAGERTGRRTAADMSFNAPAPEEPSFNGKVLSTSSNKPGVVLFRPISFGDSVKAADDLKDRKAVIVNLENLDRTVSRRVVDFLSGCSYALGGSVQKIAGSTYLFCPQNMDVGGDLGNLHPDNDSGF